MSLTNSPYWFGGGVDSFYPSQINDSLRFEDGSSAYLNRTFSSAPSSTTTSTFSTWAKRGNLGQYMIWTSYVSGPNIAGYIYFNTSNKLQVYVDKTSGGSDELNVTTDAIFRDPSAWYHIVVKYDLSQASNSNKIKIYVNGELQSATYSQTGSAVTAHRLVSNGTLSNIGQSFNNTNFYDGYLSDINFIDGQALDPTSFGEAKDGTWIPKSYSGSYGTNGFHLEFNGNTNDTSGNGNNWTANNISAHDYVPDSPTNVFATYNPLDGNATSYSEGNLRFVGDTAGNYWKGGISTFGVSSGKWYWEMYAIDGEWANVGILPSADQRGSIASTTNIDYLLNARRYIKDGTKSIGTGSSRTTSAYGASWTTGDIIGVALDMDAGTIVFYKNGSSQGTAFTGITGVQHPHATGIFSGSTIANFGQDSTFAGNTTAGGNTDGNGIGDFKHPVPSGFLALASANLPEPTIIDASEYFNTVLYSGNGGTQSITGVGFQPDFVWLKGRNFLSNHRLNDVVRGASASLKSNATSPEDTTSTYYVTSFDSDGFSLNSGNGDVNQSGGTFASWNWKAGTAFSNSAGSNGATIASSGSVNTDAGFSIVSYTGSGSNGTVLHGLSSAPEIIFFKKREVSTSWMVYNKTIGNNRFLYLDLPNTQTGTDSTYFNNLDPTASVINLGTYHRNNSSTEPYIAYCFHSVEGYSKVGSYTGGGSNFPFVFTGFRPSWIMFKGATVSSHWLMFDATRHPSNVNDLRLFANLTNGDDSAYALDLLSNGFKLRHSGSDFNASGHTYIYLAFAENPFKYANAR